MTVASRGFTKGLAQALDCFDTNFHILRPWDLPSNDTAAFRQINRHVSETIDDRHMSTMEDKTNRKSHIGFRLVPISMILNEPEQP